MTADVATDILDDRQPVSRADILLDRPVHRSEGGLPVGNGRIGTLAWTSPAALHLQPNCVDVFACNRCDGRTGSCSPARRRWPPGGKRARALPRRRHMLALAEAARKDLGDFRKRGRKQRATGDARKLAAKIT